MKVNLRYQGREIAHKELGSEVLHRVMEKLSDLAVPEVEPKMEGKQLFVVMAPDISKVRDYEARKKKKEQDEKKADSMTDSA